MKDILRELQSLSLKLQRREMTLVDSSVHIKQTINVLTAMKTTGGGDQRRRLNRASHRAFLRTAYRSQAWSRRSKLLISAFGLESRKT
ncbi:hypothetical protein JOQ06_014222 [Pogonophryne albipinna]|uniref:Uncharacterized protein n=1 Tax=Pogonophryne albipinna TaxID=1090488 RepID=A0AAD6AC07_9TELE|nr:hypothetical protein JOQ06_014222 [Pogonophryne albipinna]